MDVEVHLSERLQVFLERGGAIITGALKKGFTKVVLLVEATAKRTAYAGHPDHLQGDTGRFRQSITHEIPFPEGYVGSNVAYAAIHEFGGTILPRTAQWLTIPAEGVKGYARDRNDLHFVPVRPDLALLLDGGDQLVYTLVKQVEIEPRPTFGPALEATKPRIPEVMGNTLYGEMAT